MIVLKKINQTNYKECISLRTTDEQKQFVCVNWYSLLESLYEKNRHALGIYLDDAMIGFMMFSHYPADASYAYDSWWIERLMIDTKFQNMGYGKEALIQGIHWFDQNISENVLRISAVKTNDVALKLYEKLSFIRTGEELEGEIVLLKTR